MDELRELVEPKEQEFTELWSRMDTDRLLYNLDTYVMKQLDDQDMPNVVNVTLNAPQSYADKVISVISGAISQIVVEGDNFKKGSDEASVIERCLTDVFAAADERLSGLEYPLLNTFHAAQFALRGRSGMRIALRMSKDEIIPDIIPLDPHYYSYDLSTKGLDWLCFSILRSKAKILMDYKVEFDEKDKDTNAEVRDFWNFKEEVIYVKSIETKRQRNPYGYPPFVTQICNTGSFLMDKESMVRHGESVYAPLRTMYPELNRIASILATQALAAIKPGLQKQVEDEGIASPPTLDRTPGIARVVPVTKGYEYLPLPSADMNRATQTYWSIIQSFVQQGSISTTEYGNVTFPLSAVAIRGLAAKNDTIYLPRIQAMAMLYQKAARMIINQLIKIGKPIKVSVGGMRKVYQPSDLEGEYKIGFKFFSISPEEEIANYSVGAAAKSLGLSQDTIFRSILKLQDPEGEIRKRTSEDAEELDPAIKLYRQGHRLIDAEDYVEAELTLQSLERLLKQRAMPPLPMPATTTPEQPKSPKGFNAGANLVPLLGKSGGRAKVAAEQLPQEAVNAS